MWMKVGVRGKSHQWEGHVRIEEGRVGKRENNTWRIRALPLVKQ